MAEVKENEVATRAEDNAVGANNEEGTVNQRPEGEGQEQYQPTKLESFFAITKSLIIRAIIIYFITSFFRRPAQPVGEPGTTAPAKLPAFNLFENGTMMFVMVILLVKWLINGYQ